MTYLDTAARGLIPESAKIAADRQLDLDLAGRADKPSHFGLIERVRAGEQFFPTIASRLSLEMWQKTGQMGQLASSSFDAEAMDSHGGWLASAVDLVRLASAFDRPETCRILKADNVRTMFARPEGAAGHEPDGKPKAAYYGCGWMVRPVGAAGKANTWHAGGLDGTSTLLVRRHDGLAWAVLFNTQRGTLKDKDLAAAIDPLVHQAVDAVRRWPEAGKMDHE
jgi:hypothetical protein